jgi:hypothetical protein
VNYWLCWRHSRQLFAFSLLILFVAVQAQAKPIWLRNRIIAPAKTQGLTAASSAQPVSGLFIVQFTGALEPGQRSQLAGLGVHLLRYVPEDSFVARFRGARPDLVRALPFVEWVEEYGPDLKTHPSLQPKAGQASAEKSQAVAVLLVAARHSGGDSRIPRRL